MTVFVTVGTTKFDKLIKIMCSEEIIFTLYKKKYKKLVLQIGNGDFIPEQSYKYISVSFFRFKDSLFNDLLEADIIISHGGAGTAMEALNLAKPLILVVNNKLMGNHQLELTTLLEKNGYAKCCTCDELYEILRTDACKFLRPFPPAQPYKFAEYLDIILKIK